MTHLRQLPREHRRRRTPLALLLGLLVLGIFSLWLLVPRSETGRSVPKAGVSSEPVAALASPSRGAQREPAASGDPSERTAMFEEVVDGKNGDGLLGPLATRVVARVVDGHGRPLAGIHATLRGGESDGGRWLRRAAWEQELVTGEAGGVRFDEVPARGWSAVLELTHASRGLVLEPLGQLAGGSVTDLGNLVLARPGSVRGRVVDERGGALRGTVTWRPPGGIDAAPRGVGEVDSAPDGSFTIELTPGLVELAAWADGRVGRWSVPVPVRSGELVDGVELVLLPAVSAAGRIFDRESGDGVSGRVELRSSSGATIAAADSDEQGRFEVGGLLPGDEVSLSIDAPGHRLALEQEGSFGDPCRIPVTPERLATPLEVPVLPDDVRPAVLRVIDGESGAPIAGARVVPRDGRPSFPILLPSEDILGATDREGRAVREGGWPRGAAVEAPGYRGARLSLGETVGQELHLRLHPSLRLEVLVTQGGLPAPGARVELRCRPRGRPIRPDELDRAFPLIDRGRSDPEGHVAFEGLPERHVVLWARTEDGRSGCIAEIDASTPAPVLVSLEPFALVHGRVTPHGPAGAPRVVVLAQVSSGMVFSAQPDASGSYELWLPAGQVDVVVRRAGRRWKSDGYWHAAARRLVLAPSEVRALALPGFPAPGSVRGRLDPGGRPARFQRVVCSPVDLAPGLLWREVRETASDAHGRFQLDDLPAGAWRLEWHRTDPVQGSLVAEAEVRVHPGAVTEVLVEPTTSPVRLTLLHTGEEPDAPAARLRRADMPEEEWARTLIVPPEGPIELQLAPGTYLLPGPEGTPVSFDVRAGEPLELELSVELTSWFVIHGCVF